MRKGAAGMPVEFLIIIVIAVILLGIVFVILNPLPGIADDEAAKAALTSCCINYKLSDGCLDPDPNFVCNVPETVSSDGKMEISELSSEVGLKYQEYCC